MDEKYAYLILGIVLGVLLYHVSDIEIDVKKWLDKYDEFCKKKG